jgi:hypothetical protein
MADRDVQPAHGTAGGPYSRVAPRLRIEVRAPHYSAVWRPTLACVRAGDRRRAAGNTRGGTAWYGRAVRIPRRPARRGTGGSDLEAVWERARTDTEAGAMPCARSAARRSRQGAWRASGALERDRPVFQPVNPTLTVCFSKNLNCATKTVDTKVVDETSLYNICNGRPVFFSTV